ncbi:hypothetical protein Trydic_g9185 [Trypoxylus dichotomus]
MADDLPRIAKKNLKKAANANKPTKREKLSFEVAQMDRVVAAPFPKHPEREPDAETEEPTRRGRKDHSTIGAIQEIVNTYQSEQCKNSHTRQVVTLVPLDVKNTFISARWNIIRDALEGPFDIPHYLLRVIRSYLRDRELKYETTEGCRHVTPSAAATQGSILGPNLYADDIATTIVATDKGCSKMTHQAMRRITTWMGDHRLKLATQNTEIALLSGRRIPLRISLKVNTDSAPRPSPSDD